VVINQRHASSDAPAAELPPAFLLAEVPTVIAPKNDDCVLRVGSLFECVEDTTDHRVGVGNGSEVTLHRFTPLVFLLDNMFVVTAVDDTFRARREIVEVVLFVAWRQLDRLQWKRLEVFLRDKPRDVRSENTTTEKERLFVFALQLFHDPVGDEFVTARFLVIHIERGPVELDIHPRMIGQTDRSLLRIERTREGALLRLFGVVVVPRGSVDKIVEQFAAAECLVTVAREVLRDNLLIGHPFPHLLSVVVNAATVGLDASEDRRT